MSKGDINYWKQIVYMGEGTIQYDIQDSDLGDQVHGGT